MSDAISFVIDLRIKAGEIDNFRALMAEMVASAEANEPGTVNYEWYVSDDERICHIYERYADSQATVTHLGTFAEKFADRFMAVLEPTRFMVYGDASAEVREIVGQFGAVCMNPAAGSTGCFRIFSGVLAATSSISIPPSVEAMIVTVRVARSITIPR